ncbi:MAG: glycosyltransferase family 39 protein [Bacteroidetes bacterium]|nr:glycosyltransferase family 39 protein [Bacteroidota bacterium]
MNRLLTVIRNRPYELLTTLAILVFILFKLPDIGIPYHWDEMGVYVPAAFRMMDNGHISLLPASIEPLYSRGHPLLFTFCNALVFKLFGETVTVGHIFALFLGVATLILFFLLAKSLFSKKIAFFATVLLMAQPIFFTMAVQVLPEMMVAFFTLLSFYGILNKKWVIYALGGSLAMMTKESAIAIPATALIALLIETIREKDLLTLKRMKLFLLGATPLLVFGLFLIIQKVQNGWYLFPEHLGYIHWVPAKLSKEAGRLFNDMLTGQGRWLTGIPFLAGIVLALFSKRLKIEAKGKNLWTFALFILLVFIFCLVNYYLTRYILYVIPFIILGGTWTVLTMLEKVFANLKGAQWVTVGLFCIYGVQLGHTNMMKSPDTCDMSYKRVVNVTQQAIRWAEQNWSKDTIEANFPVFQAIEDPRNGYLAGKPIAYTANYTHPRKYGVLFYMWDTTNIPIGPSLRYYIIKTFDDSWAHVAAVGFERTDSISPAAR